jgi:Ni/Co efflux regulator RcnB
MKTRLSLLIAAAVIGMSAGPVMAQSHGHGGDDHGDYGKNDKHQDKRDEKRDDRSDDRGDDRGDDRHDRRDDRRYYGMHDRGRHEGWYRRGGYVPREYRDGRYVVTDWHRERLREPPRGYHWVRSDNGDFLLVAVATGIITELLLHH